MGCTVFYQRHTSCEFNIRCGKSFTQLYHENNAQDEVIKVLQAAFSKYPGHVNNQGMWHYVGCFSNFSLPLCRGSSKYRKPEKRSEEDSNSSFMAALRLKVAEKKLEKISLMALKFSSSTIFSHLQPSSIGSLVQLVTLSQVCHAFLDKHGKKCEMLQ